MRRLCALSTAWSDMGRYDGILIMSDWDGTLCADGVVTEDNCEAIRRFQAEGGLFTVCSGRNSTHFDKFRHFLKPNAPICAYNGALITDGGRAIFESFISEDVLQMAKTVIENHLFPKMCIYTKENGGPVVCNFKDFCRNFDKYTKMHHYKLVFIGETEEQTLLGREYINAILPEGYVAARSWPTGLEILRASATKDKALAFLRAHTGARLVVAAGDFENDAEMLAAADIGYAVANAVPTTKAAADRITVSVRESAIARIIDEL